MSAFRSDFAISAKKNEKLHFSQKCAFPEKNIFALDFVIYLNFIKFDFSYSFDATSQKPK